MVSNYLLFIPFYIVQLPGNTSPVEMGIYQVRFLLFNALTFLPAWVDDYDKDTNICWVIWRKEEGHTEQPPPLVPTLVKTSPVILFPGRTQQAGQSVGGVGKKGGLQSSPPHLLHSLSSLLP